MYVNSKLAPSMFNPLNKIFLKRENWHFPQRNIAGFPENLRASFGQQVVGQKSADCLKLEQGKCQYFTCPIPKRVKNYWGSTFFFEYVPLSSLLWEVFRAIFRNFEVMALAILKGNKKNFICKILVLLHKNIFHHSWLNSSTYDHYRKLIVTWYF